MASASATDSRSISTSSKRPKGRALRAQVARSEPEASEDQQRASEDQKAGKISGMDARIFLDEFRPFRRGEIALARRVATEPRFLPERELALLRHALRLAQLSSLAGGAPDELVDRIGSLRLRLLQLLAPVLPTEPARIDAARLAARLPKVVALCGEARRRIFDAGLAGETALDAELATKRLALVLGGAAGSGYVFLGALERLAHLDLVPSYLAGCSVGSILAVIRARTTGFALGELLDDVRRLRERGVFRAPTRPRFGLPGALRLDLRSALGSLFEVDGRQQTLAELTLPTDVLTTGLGPGALAEPGEAFARMIDLELSSASALEKLPRSALARLVGPLVSLAMSRQVLVPLLLGADPETRQLAALDAAGFSAAIPGLLSYDLEPDDEEGARILAPLFARHSLTGLVDGAVSTLIPARYAWEAIEAGRIGTRHVAILALDAFAKPRGANALMLPLLHAIAATADRDRAFWDLHVNFRRAPTVIDIFPSASRLEAAAANGAREFADTARVLPHLFASVPPWKDLAPETIAHVDDRFV
jgi:predicted acylesterase/phospholipase RssA